MASVSPTDPTGSMGGAAAPTGSSDPTTGLVTSWVNQQMSSGAERKDEDKYKQKSQNAFGNDPFGTSGGGGGGMGGGMI